MIGLSNLFINKRINLLLNILLLCPILAFTQNDKVIQAFEPHPVVELDSWQVHTGDLSVEEVFADNPYFQHCGNIK